MKLHVAAALLCTISLGSQAMESDSWDGKVYDSASDEQYKNAVRHLEQRELKRFKSILDLCCGSGRVTEYMESRAPEALIIGIDKSPSMIEKARSKKLPIAFEVGDAEAIPYTNNFDFVFSFGGLHWIRNLAAVFQSISNSLKSDGQALLSGVSNATQHPLVGAFTELQKMSSWSEKLSQIKPEDQFFPLDETNVRALLSQVNLNLKKLDRENVVVTFKDQEALKLHLSGFMGALPAISKLEEANKQVLIADLAKCYVACNQQTEKGIQYIVPQMVIDAKKS